MNQLGITVISKYMIKPINPISRMPAPATFAIIVNSSFVGFLVSLRTRVYSPSLKGIFIGICLSSTNIFHIHDLNDTDNVIKAILK